MIKEIKIELTKKEVGSITWAVEIYRRGIRGSCGVLLPRFPRRRTPHLWKGEREGEITLVEREALVRERKKTYGVFKEERKRERELNLIWYGSPDTKITFPFPNAMKRMGRLLRPVALRLGIKLLKLRFGTKLSKEEKKKVFKIIFKFCLFFRKR